MTFTVATIEAGVVRLTIEGELDVVTTSELRKGVDKLIDEKPRRIEVNLTSLRMVAWSRMSPSMSSTSAATSARFSRFPEKKLSTMRTFSPRASSARAIEDPMNPAPPVMR